MSEIRIHRALHHPNIVAFEHFFEDNDNVYILLELCQNQTLNELLKRRRRLTELEVQNYSLQLLDAISYLHRHRIIHREYFARNRSLKLGNLFLTDRMQLKIGDFGLATRLEFDGDRKRTICGTPNYIAPEVLDGKQGHSYEADIWSFGVILYTLLIGKPPFEASDVKATYRRIKANAYSFPDRATISSNAKDLITKILNLDPARRIAIDAIYDHPFFHSGNSIPKLLPASTLACPPSSSYMKQFYGNKPGVDVYALDSPQEESAVSAKSNRLAKKPKSSMASADRARLKTGNSPECRGLSQLVWVRKWVDFSSKYGLGYFLSNGVFGVFFNDSTKIVLDLAATYFSLCP